MAYYHNFMKQSWFQGSLEGFGQAFKDLFFDYVQQHESTANKREYYLYI